VIDNSTAPLRTARQVFEEVEEIAFSLKRTRRVTVHSETSDEQPPDPSRQDAGQEAYEYPAQQVSSHDERSSLRHSVADVEGLSLSAADRDRTRALTQREGPAELRSPEHPRQLPPGK
jgi:hypothetical protein